MASRRVGIRNSASSTDKTLAFLSDFDRLYHDCGDLGGVLMYFGKLAMWRKLFFF